MGVVSEFFGKFFRILMNIFGEVEELIFGFDKDVFVFPLKESTRMIMLFLEIHGVGDGEATHKVGNSSFGIVLVDKEVKVVGHQGVGNKMERVHI